MNHRIAKIALLLGLTGMGLAMAGSLQAGTITGTIQARGAPETSEPDNSDAYQSHRYKFAERIDYDQLKDFVVYIDQPMPDRAAGQPPPAAVVKQMDAMFVPHILPIVVGTTVEWPNEDDIYHNVFSMSETAQFDLGLYDRNHPAKRVTFTKPGRVDVFCAIHTKMHCILLVLPNPYFALADSRGRFVIKGVPPGVYQLRGWHERLPSQVREITVPEQGEIKVDFVLGLGGLPKY
ncbi:MAG: carboxypeptidase regulatory-like domain-containing protein [Opitutaceae bacterium]